MQCTVTHKKGGEQIKRKSLKKVIFMLQIPKTVQQLFDLPPHPSSITHSPHGGLKSSVIPLPLQTQSCPLLLETATAVSSRNLALHDSLLH